VGREAWARSRPVRNPSLIPSESFLLDYTQQIKIVKLFSQDFFGFQRNILFHARLCRLFANRTSKKGLVSGNERWYFGRTGRNFVARTLTNIDWQGKKEIYASLKQEKG
jgi:hypothetical protein